MNQNNTAYKILIGIACAVAAATAVSLYFALTIGYDISIRHFAVDSVGAMAAAVCVCIAIVPAVTAGILRHRNKNCVGFSALSTPQAFTAAVTAFMLFASFILSIRALATGLPLLEIARLVLMALAAAYFFLTALRDRKPSGAYSLLSLCPLMYALVSLLSVYFDKSYGMNSPVKTYYLLMYMAMTLFFSGEVRVVLGRTLPFWYTAFGVMSLCLTAGVGLSHTAIALNDTAGHGFSLIDSAVFVCIALYTAVRLFAFGTPVETPAAEEIAAASPDYTKKPVEEDKNDEE